MTCKPFINAINSVSQTLLTNGLIEYATANINSGCGIDFVSGSNAITITRAGYYKISLDVDISPATAGAIGIQLINNGNAIPGALSTFTGTLGDVEHLHVQTIIRVLNSCKCVTNNAVIQAQLIENGGIVSNVNIIVEAIKM